MAIGSSPSVEHEVASLDRIVLVADAQMRYLAASESACRLLGYTREELLATRATEVVEETDAGRDREDGRGRPPGRQITLVCWDGRRVRAHYDAREAQAEGVTYYVSLLTPPTPVARRGRGVHGCGCWLLTTISRHGFWSGRALVVQQVEVTGAADGAEPCSCRRTRSDW